MNQLLAGRPVHQIIRDPESAAYERHCRQEQGHELYSKSACNDDNQVREVGVSLIFRYFIESWHPQHHRRSISLWPASNLARSASLS